MCEWARDLQVKSFRHPPHWKFGRLSPVLRACGSFATVPLFSRHRSKSRPPKMGYGRRSQANQCAGVQRRGENRL